MVAPAVAAFHPVQAAAHQAMVPIATTIVQAVVHQAMATVTAVIVLVRSQAQLPVATVMTVVQVIMVAVVIQLLGLILIWAVDMLITPMGRWLVQDVAIR